MTLLKEGLEGDAGEFRTGSFPAGADVDDAEEGDVKTAKTAKERKARAKAKDAKYVRFAVGVAATGNPPNVAGRLFKREFDQEVHEKLYERSEYRHDFSGPRDRSTWSQDAITWRFQLAGTVDAVLLAHVPCSSFRPTAQRCPRRLHRSFPLRASAGPLGRCGQARPRRERAPRKPSTGEPRRLRWRAGPSA